MSDGTDALSTEYIFRRNVNASIRLNFMHWIWKTVFGYLLHPDIEIPKNAAIADVACGTGTWLVELWQELALDEATFAGFDIDLGQIPGGGASFPKNVSLEELDIMQTLPQHLEEKFDIVHVRGLGFILGAGGPQVDMVLKNLVKMLKPGGWLQWEEYDRTNLKFIKAREDSSTAFIEKMWAPETIEDARAKVGNWIPQLTEHYTAEGLTATAFDRRWTPPHWLGTFQLNGLAAHDELVSGLPEGNAYKVKMQAGQNGLAKDVQSGGACDMPMINVIGKKPLR